MPEGKFLLSTIGKTVDTAIQNISKYYNSIKIDKYVIMPNHIHLILIIETSSKKNTAIESPAISQVIKQMKGYVTKHIGFSIWQKSYYDHIIRDQNQYLDTLEYIETNPLKWAYDKYYTHYNL